MDSRNPLPRTLIEAVKYFAKPDNCLSYMVARRRNEIGIRMALGADRREIVAMVMREAGRLLAAGLAIGTLSAIAAARSAQTLLFGLSPYDPSTLVASAALLAAVAALASCVPAVRASSLSPIEALRAWMLLFVDYIATKQIIASALNAYVGGPSKLYEGSRAQVQGAIDALVKRAINNRDIRRDLEPFDLLRALIGVSNVASGPDWQQSARRLVDILITGSRPIK